MPRNNGLAVVEYDSEVQVAAAVIATPAVEYSVVHALSEYRLTVAVAAEEPHSVLT